MNIVVNKDFERKFEYIKNRVLSDVWIGNYWNLFRDCGDGFLWYYKVRILVVLNNYVMVVKFWCIIKKNIYICLILK